MDQQTLSDTKEAELQNTQKSNDQEVIQKSSDQEAIYEGGFADQILDPVRKCFYGVM